MLKSDCVTRHYHSAELRLFEGVLVKYWYLLQLMERQLTHHLSVCLLLDVSCQTCQTQLLAASTHWPGREIKQNIKSNTKDKHPDNGNVS